MHGDANYQKNYFESRESYEEDIFQIPRGAKLEKMFDKTIKPGDKVLDIGCGIGFLHKTMKKRNAHIYGVDISNLALREAKKRGYIVKKGNIEQKLPFAAGFFDAVICLEVIEHMHEYESLLMEMKRVLKKNGTLILSTPNSVSLNARIRVLFGQKILTMLAPSHIQCFTKKELKNALHKCGFRHISIKSSYIPILPKVTPFTPVLGPIVSIAGDLLPTFGDTFMIIAKK